MKKIVLKSIELSNWRGQNRIVKFNDGVTTIAGRNGTGKTSIMEAFFWLLSGYTSPTMAKNTNLFDEREELTKDTPEAIVSAKIMIDDLEYSITKKAKAKFKKDTSTGEYVKAPSDTYTMLVDSMEFSASMFQEWLEANICSANLIPYLLHGSFFTTLVYEDKNEARKLLKDFSDATISNIGDEYSFINEQKKKGYTIDMIETSLRGEKKELDKKLSFIDGEINSKRTFISTNEEDFDAIRAQIKVLSKELSDIENGNESLKQKKKIESDLSGLYSKMSELTRIERERKDKRVDEAYSRLLKAESKLKNHMKSSTTKEEIEDVRNEVERLEAEKANLLKEHEFISKTKFDGKCPTCGQDIPQEASEEREMQFLKSKKDKLEQIKTIGKRVSLELKNKRMLLVAMSSSIHNEQQELQEIRKEVDDCKALYYEEVNKEATNDEIERVKKEIDKLSKKCDENSDEDNKEEELKCKINNLTSLLGRESLIGSTKEELENLILERKKVADRFVSLEGNIQLCKAYKQECAEILSKDINKGLTNCRIEMWEKKKDGELTPSCAIVSNDGVRFSTMNTAKRLLIESELQDFFCERVGVSFPTFYDEANRFDEYNTPKRNDKQVVLIKVENNLDVIIC